MYLQSTRTVKWDVPAEHKNCKVGCTCKAQSPEQPGEEAYIGDETEDVARPHTDEGTESLDKRVCVMLQVPGSLILTTVLVK